MKLGTIITNESLGTESPEEILEAAQTTTEVTEASYLSQADGQKIEATDSAIADAEATEDKLCELVEVAQTSLDNEGMSEKEAVLIELSHESLMASIGLPVQRTTYTRESFKSKDSRHEVAVATLENLIDSAKKVGASIMAAMKAAWNSVSNFLVGLLKNRAMMEKHLTNLFVKVKGMDASLKPKVERVAAGGKLGGTAQSASAVILDAETLIHSCVTVSAALNTTSPEKAVRTAISSSKMDGRRVVGNRIVKVTSDKDGIKIEFVSPTSSYTEIETDGIVLTQDQMRNLLHLSIDAVKSLRSFEKTQGSLKAAFSTIMAHLAEGVSGVKASVAGKGSKFMAGIDVEIKRSARIARTIMNKVGGSIPSIVFAGVKAAGDYVTASMNAYSNNAAEEKK